MISWPLTCSEFYNLGLLIFRVYLSYPAHHLISLVRPTASFQKSVHSSACEARGKRAEVFEEKGRSSAVCRDCTRRREGARVGLQAGGRLQGGGSFASEPGGWRSLHVGGRSARAAVCYG